MCLFSWITAGPIFRLLMDLPTIDICLDSEYWTLLALFPNDVLLLAPVNQVLNCHSVHLLLVVMVLAMGVFLALGKSISIMNPLSPESHLQTLFSVNDCYENCAVFPTILKPSIFKPVCKYIFSRHVKKIIIFVNKN